MSWCLTLENTSLHFCFLSRPTPPFVEHMFCENSQLWTILVAVKQIQLDRTICRFYKDYLRLARGFRIGLLRFVVVHELGKVRSNLQVLGEVMAVSKRFPTF